MAIRMWTRRATVVSIAVMLMAATACGASAKTKHQASAKAQHSSAASPSGDPFRIGVPAKLSGPGKSVYEGISPVAGAWMKWVNAQGGINGHPVEVLLKDTAGDASKGLTAVQELVESEQVSALIPEDGVVDTVMRDYLVPKGVPAISTTPFYPVWNSTPGWYSIALSINPEINEAFMNLVKLGGARSVATVVCAEVAACASLDPTLRRLASDAGIPYKGLQKVAASSPSYTAECLALKQSGADSVILAVSVDVTLRFMKECNAQGYNPLAIFGNASLSPELAELKDMKALAVEPTLPWYASGPAMRDFREAVGKYGDLKEMNESSMFLWAALEFFREAMIASHVTPSASHDAVDTALSSLKTNLNGMIADVRFTKGEPSPHVRCYFIASYERGEFGLPYGDKAKCLDH